MRYKLNPDLLISLGDMLVMILLFVTPQETQETPDPEKCDGDDFEVVNSKEKGKWWYFVKPPQHNYSLPVHWRTEPFLDIHNHSVPVIIFNHQYHCCCFHGNHRRQQWYRAASYGCRGSLWNPWQFPKGQFPQKLYSAVKSSLPLTLPPFGCKCCIRKHVYTALDFTKVSSQNLYRTVISPKLSLTDLLVNVLIWVLLVDIKLGRQWVVSC